MARFEAEVVSKCSKSAVLAAMSIQFDYTYDTANFFNTQAKKDLLAAAASVFTSRITDDLAAIAPHRQ